MEPTVNDLKNAMGAFLIAFSASMPKELAERIANNLIEQHLQMSQNGQTTVAKVCEGFVEALLLPHDSIDEQTEKH